MLGFLTLHPSSFGLDLSDLSLKIAQLQKKRDGFNLVSYGEEILGEGIIEEGVIKDENRLVEAIRRTLSKVKGKQINTKHVVAALPEEKAFLQVVQLPKMSKAELASAVRFQAENFIPYPIDTVYLDFSIVTPMHNHLDHIDVLIGSLPRAVVDSYVSVLQKADLFPTALEIDAVALARAVVEKGISPIPMLVVDIGQARTKLSIYSGYSVRFTTSLPISSQQFTDAVSRGLKVDEEKAEQLKREYGLYAPEDKLSQEVFQSLVPVATDFIEQVSKYLDYYQDHVPHQHLGTTQKQIKKIMLCGGGANLKGLPEFLTRALKVEAVVGNPWVNILPRNAKELPLLSFQESLSFSCVLGLALRGAGEKNIHD